MNENLQNEPQIKIEKQTHQEKEEEGPSISLDSVEKISIKQEPVDESELSIVSKRCRHSKVIEKIMLKCSLLIQSALRKKRAKIKRLEEEKNQLIENDKKRLNEINLLKRKLSNLSDIHKFNSQQNNVSTINMVGL